MDLLVDLLADLEYGNCPGSKIRHDGEVIWLHTTNDVKAWLLSFYQKRSGGS